MPPTEVREPILRYVDPIVHGWFGSYLMRPAQRNVYRLQPVQHRHPPVYLALVLFAAHAFCFEAL